MNNYLAKCSPEMDLHENPEFSLVEHVGDNSPLGAVVRLANGKWIGLDYHMDESCNQVFYPIPKLPQCQELETMSEAVSEVVLYWSASFIETNRADFLPDSDYEEPKSDS